ncbi:MAG: hopanoid biosynthesis-associated protein HpnK [Methylovirgula sp.]
MTRGAEYRNRLIITADDFGAAEEINEAVEAAHRFGVLSSASLMVNGRAAQDAIGRARAWPDLHVGLHLVLTEARPILPPECVPDLVDRRGWLRRDLARLGAEIACRPKLRRQLRAEIEAQFEAYAQTGLALDHVDAHQHFHLHPIVAREIISIGCRFGMRALRVPAEPARLLFRLEPRLGAAALLRPLTAALRGRVRRAGLASADAVFGLRWSGAFTPQRMALLLANLPPGAIEIYTHPAIGDRFPGAAPGYRYREEFEALRAPAVISALRRSGFPLGGYAELLAVREQGRKLTAAL